MQMATTDIVNMTKTDVAVVAPDYNITEVLHKLVDAEPFLPVVDLFSGIFHESSRASPSSRPSLSLHDFSKEYEIDAK